MQKNLKMVFINASSAAVTLTLPSVKDDVTSAEVIATMDIIIANNIFESSGGNLISKKAASIVSTDTQDLTIS